MLVATTPVSLVHGTKTSSRVLGGTRQLGCYTHGVETLRQTRLWGRRRSGSTISRTYRCLWFVLVLAATGLRLPSPAWDAGIAAHPDERFLLGAAAATSLVGNLCAAVQDFPYGHLPVRVAQLLMITAPGADPLFAARLLSGLIGTAIVIAAGACGEQIAGREGRLSAAAMAALSPFLIQQARFYTVDPLGTLLATGAVLMACRRRWRSAGFVLGLAVACKVSLSVAVVPIALAALQTGVNRRSALRKAGSVLLFASVSFLLVSPWALLSPIACWRGPYFQSLMAGGVYVFPYTQQYLGTRPFVYPLAQMALWGLGPLPVVLGGLGLLVGMLDRDRRVRRFRHPAWLWPLVAHGSIAGLMVKFPRYLLPLYPWWVAWAAYALRWVCRRCGRRAGYSLTALALASTGLLGLAQANLYARPHPWITASEWIGDHVVAGSTLAVEAWDHPLPVPLVSVPVADYRHVVLPSLDGEGPAKAAELDSLYEQSDATVLASRRGYGALSRRREEHAATLTWYGEVLSGQQVHVFARCPAIGPLAITDDPLLDAGLPLPAGASLAERCGVRYVLRLPRLDESFRVYDAPTVVVAIATP